jgi:hypothetical protein
MNSPEQRLERLLAAAQKACPPIPEPPNWLDQRVLQALRSEEDAWKATVRFIWPLLAGAALLMTASLAIRPSLQRMNPYMESLEMIKVTTQQIERTP